MQQRQLIAAQTRRRTTRCSWRCGTARISSWREQLAQDFVKKTQARFNAGTVARLNVVKGQVDAAQAENDLIANERGIANARAGLNRLLGRVLGAAIEPADTLGVPVVPPDLARLEQLAMTYRPELRGIQRQRESARASEQLAQQQSSPT